MQRVRNSVRHVRSKSKELADQLWRQRVLTTPLVEIGGCIFYDLGEGRAEQPPTRDDRALRRLEKLGLLESRLAERKSA